MKKESKISNLTLAILGLIQQHQQSGYDLRKAFSHTPMGSFSSSTGTVYPALKRIEQSGWVEKVKDTYLESTRNRQSYRITDTGRSLLKSQCLRKITREDILHNMEGILLCFTFMEGLCSHEEELVFLSQFKHEVQCYLDELQLFYKDHFQNMPVHGAMSLEYGIKGYQMSLQWIIDTIHTLKEKNRRNR